MTTTIRGASVLEQELYDYLSAHIENESEILADYRELAEHADAPALTYIARLILEDEERHHALLHDLAESIKRSAELRGEEQPVPSLHGLHHEKDRFLARTERFLQMEREDLKHLKALAKQLRDYKDTTMWSLLVESMQDDTRKHIRFLSFVRDRLRKGY